MGYTLQSKRPACGTDERKAEARSFCIFCVAADHQRQVVVGKQHEHTQELGRACGRACMRRRCRQLARLSWMPVRAAK